ncbi:MAG: 30S ribosomal protein S12 methylthiotransferase RimO [Mucinivorans sp.]
MKKINIITLGCAKNVVDSEHLAGALSRGYQIVFDDEMLDSEVVVINTCGFILDAKQESVDMILRAVGARTEGSIKELYVMGCLSERYADDLRTEIPEVDQFFGVNDFSKIVERLGVPLGETSRKLTTPPHYAYLKISEGCAWRCGYCAIPLIRGGHRSVPIEELMAEAKDLAARGVKELIVIAQDTTFYGMDLYGERCLAKLLTALCQIDGIEWIRLHYTYPAAFPGDVIEVISRQKKICRYIDIPFQHIADHVLSAMHRHISKAQTLALIAELRDRIPGLALRTTLLVGYPGESEADFAELVDFVKTAKIDRLGVFPYSAEEGTFSAENLVDDVPSDEKERRAEKIMALQAEVALELNERKVGQCFRVIVDRREGDYFVARTEFDSPEVDPEVLILADGHELCPGEFYQIEIISADQYDIYGRIL